MAHASRALQSHDMSGEGIIYGSHTFFWSHKGMEACPDEGTAQRQDSTNMKDDTHHSRTHSFQQGEYERMIMMAK